MVRERRRDQDAEFNRGVIAERERIADTLLKEADTLASITAVRAVRHYAFRIKEGKL
jgi:hypothetical protein